MATQIFSETQAPEECYRWSFCYAHGKLEEMLDNFDIFFASEPKPSKDGYYEMFFIDAQGERHPCTAKLVDDNGCINGIVTLDEGVVYHHTA